MSQFHVSSFNINLSNGFTRLKALASQSELPQIAEYPGVGSKFGIDLDDLKALRKRWVEEYNWDEEQAKLNSFSHHKVTIEGLDIHFIHEKSEDESAIPLVLLHGWPGSFVEFLPIIKPLTQTVLTSNGKKVSYNVVVPSLPGFMFSSAPPEDWTVDATARIFNTLMTEVLGYKTFALHGTDWGCAVGYSLYNQFADSVRAAHFPFIPFVPPFGPELAAINLTPIGKFGAQRTIEWLTGGSAYNVLQTTKPNTIGLALYDSPIGQLAWLAEKYRLWSDPTAVSPASQLDDTAILTSVSLFYLTKSFLSACYIYAQNPAAFRSTYTKANNNAPLLFSTFKYNVAFWPESYVQRVGNLVSYKEHESGGHFPGLDAPQALIKDIRDIANYVSR